LDYTFFILKKLYIICIDYGAPGHFLAKIFPKGIVGAVVIFNHGLKFGIVFLVSDHSAHEKLIASKKKFFTIEKLVLEQLNYQVNN
jgi:hypothetical protein